MEINSILVPNRVKYIPSSMEVYQNMIHSYNLQIQALGHARANQQKLDEHFFSIERHCQEHCIKCKLQRHIIPKEYPNDITYYKSSSTNFTYK